MRAYSEEKGFSNSVCQMREMKTSGKVKKIPLTKKKERKKKEKKKCLQGTEDKKTE